MPLGGAILTVESEYLLEPNAQFNEYFYAEYAWIHIIPIVLLI